MAENREKGLDSGFDGTPVSVMRETLKFIKANWSSTSRYLDSIGFTYDWQLRLRNALTTRKPGSDIEGDSDDDDDDNYIEALESYTRQDYEKEQAAEFQKFLWESLDVLEPTGRGLGIKQKKLAPTIAKKKTRALEKRRKQAKQEMKKWKKESKKSGKHERRSSRGSTAALSEKTSSDLNNPWANWQKRRRSSSQNQSQVTNHSVSEDEEDSASERDVDWSSSDTQSDNEDSLLEDERSNNENIKRRSTHLDVQSSKEQSQRRWSASGSFASPEPVLASGKPHRQHRRAASQSIQPSEVTEEQPLSTLYFFMFCMDEILILNHLYQTICAEGVLTWRKWM